MAFRGWPAEAITFYEGLEADNSKTYWTAHKDVYESAVVAPFRALSDEVADTFGPLRLFRPHRDVRFSKDKSPYKTAQGAVTESEEGAIYYVALSSAGLFAGSGYYRPAPDQIARMREAIDDDTAGKALERAVATAREGGLPMRRRRTEDGAEGLREGPSPHRAAAAQGAHRREGMAAGEVVRDREGEGSHRRGVASVRRDQRVADEARRAEHRAARRPLGLSGFSSPAARPPSAPIAPAHRSSTSPRSSSVGTTCVRSPDGRCSGGDGCRAARPRRSRGRARCSRGRASVRGWGRPLSITPGAFAGPRSMRARTDEHVLADGRVPASVSRRPDVVWRPAHLRATRGDPRDRVACRRGPSAFADAAEPVLDRGVVAVGPSFAADRDESIDHERDRLDGGHLAVVRGCRGELLKRGQPDRAASEPRGPAKWRRRGVPAPSFAEQTLDVEPAERRALRLDLGDERRESIERLGAPGSPTSRVRHRLRSVLFVVEPVVVERSRRGSSAGRSRTPRGARTTDSPDGR